MNARRGTTRRNTTTNTNTTMTPRNHHDRTDADADEDAVNPYDDAGYIVSSNYRGDVLLELDRAPSTPSTIAERTGHAIAHVSRTLGHLTEHGLAELLVNEDRRKGRIYGLTDRGERAVEAVRSLEVDA